MSLASADGNKKTMIRDSYVRKKSLCGKGKDAALPLSDTGDTKCINVLKIHCQLYTRPSDLHFRDLLRTKETVSMTRCVKCCIFVWQV